MRSSLLLVLFFECLAALGFVDVDLRWLHNQMLRLAHVNVRITAYSGASIDSCLGLRGDDLDAGHVQAAV